jgi:hypothetical protein
MLITISKDNKQYIEQLKEKGFKEIISKRRNKSNLTFTDVEVSKDVLVDNERISFKTFYPTYFSNDYRECHHCHKIFNTRSIQQHIRKIHLK